MNPCARMQYWPDDPEPEEDEPWTPYHERAGIDQPACNACLRPQLWDCTLVRAIGSPSAGFKLCNEHAENLMSSDWHSECKPI